MKYKYILVILCLVCLLAPIGFSAVVTRFLFPVVANIKSLTLEFYVDSVNYTNGTGVNWGDLAPGSIYTKNFTVVNTSTYSVQVTLIVGTQPVGWTHTWTANNTILTPAAVASADLTLSVPSTAVEGNYTWNYVVWGTQQ